MMALLGSIAMSLRARAKGEIVRILLLTGAAWCLVAGAVPAAAQNVEEKKAIAGSLEKQRIEQKSGIAVDPEKSGYFQLVIEPTGFTRKALCPRDEAERDRLRSGAISLFNWALRKKKNWGASANLYFERPSVNYSDPELKPDATLKFFTVEQPSSNPDKCVAKETDTARYYSQMYPVDPDNTVQPVHVELLTWYNDVAQQSTIDKIPKIAGTLFGFVGLPAGLLGTVAGSLGFSPEEEIKRLVNQERMSTARTRLYPRQANDVQATAYLGLREPNGGDALTTQARATLTIQPISSIFSASEPYFVSLKSKTHGDILNLLIPSAVGGTPRYLFQVLGQNGDYNAIQNTADATVLSNRCETLDLYLRNTLKLSRVDAAVVLHAIAVQRGQANLTLSRLAAISCITARKTLLKKVNIDLPVDGDEAAPPASAARMHDAMLSIATLRGLTPDMTSTGQWEPVSFPLTVVDSADHFKWDGQERVYDENRAEFQELLRTSIKNFGCMVSFPDPPINFVSGLGQSIGVGNSSPIRKSAALAQLNDDSIVVIQFRYGGGGANAKIRGMSLVRRDDNARQKMLSQASCTPGVGREWMQPFLRPAPQNPQPAPVAPADTPPAETALS